MQKKECPLWQRVLAIGSYADGKRRAKDVIGSELCRRLLFNALASDNKADQVAASWATFILSMWAPAEEMRSFLHHPRVMRCLVKLAVVPSASGAGRESPLGSVVGEELSGGELDCTGDPSVCMKMMQIGGMAVDGGGGGDECVPVVCFKSGEDELLLRVMQPTPEQWPKDRDGSAFWARAVIRYSAEFVRNDEFCICKGSNAKHLGPLFGRKGVQRSLTNLSGFPCDVGFENPACATRGRKRQKWQRRRRKVRDTLSHGGDLTTKFSMHCIIYSFAFAANKSHTWQQEQAPQGTEKAPREAEKRW